MIIADTVTKAQYAIQKLISDGDAFELWLDEEVRSGSGLAFLNWLCESGYKPKFLLIITLGQRSKTAMEQKAHAEEIPCGAWAGPFG